MIPANDNLPRGIVSIDGHIKRQSMEEYLEPCYEIYGEPSLNGWLDDCAEIRRKNIELCVDNTK